MIHSVVRVVTLIKFDVLELYTSLGMRITKIHRALLFVASPFLKKWVTHCTEQRAIAASANDNDNKNFWKLMVNSCFGKFCEVRMVKK